MYIYSVWLQTQGIENFFAPPTLLYFGKTEKIIESYIKCQEIKPQECLEKLEKGIMKTEKKKN